MCLCYNHCSGIVLQTISDGFQNIEYTVGPLQRQKEDCNF